MQMLDIQFVYLFNPFFSLFQPIRLLIHSQRHFYLFLFDMQTKHCFLSSPLFICLTFEHRVSTRGCSRSRSQFRLILIDRICSALTQIEYLKRIFVVFWLNLQWIYVVTALNTTHRICRDRQRHANNGEKTLPIQRQKHNDVHMM